MSERPNHIKSYSTADIRNYLDGKLSAVEMHAMEKAAMDDPLLSDAIEGMGMNRPQGDTSFESETGELRKRLKERMNRAGKKSRVLPLIRKWQTAAAVILLIGGGALSYLFLIKKPSPDQHISLHREKDKVNDTLIQNDHFQGTPLIDSASLATNNKPDLERSSLNKNPGPDAKKRNRVDDRTEEKIGSTVKAVPKPETPSLNPASKEVSTSIPVDGKKLDSSLSPGVALVGRAAGLAVRSGAAPNQQKELNEGFYLQGTVTDSNGVPIPDAAVSLKHKKKAVKTDPNGSFKLKTDFPDSSEDIVVSAIGYKPVSAAINPAENKDKLIQLQPTANALADVVVVGYGARKKEDEETAIPVKKRTLIQEAEPVNGWSAYKHYIDKNKKVNSPDSLLKGIEIVSFLVNKKGGLSSFKIEKSISPAHDARAIRLIKEGPAWKLLKGNKHRFRLTIDYN